MTFPRRARAHTHMQTHTHTTHVNILLTGLRALRRERIARGGRGGGRERGKRGGDIKVTDGVAAVVAAVGRIFCFRFDLLPFPLQEAAFFVAAL